MDEDCTYNVQQYTDEHVYLIAIPRYYFGNDIANWNKTEVGKYYTEILTESAEEVTGIYIYHTEDGDDAEKIFKILNFMRNYEKEQFTFAQCYTCNKIATVGPKIYDFNYILTVLDICTKTCHDCYFIL